MYKVFWRLDSIELIFLKGGREQEHNPLPDGVQTLVAAEKETRDRTEEASARSAGRNTKTGGGRGGGGSSALPETTADSTGREQI